jgi:signal transduction histidine kinase
MFASLLFREKIALQPDSGFYEATYDDHIRRLIAYRRIEGVPLYVVGSTRFAGITRAWFAEMQSHLYFGIPATLGLFLLAILSARRHARLKIALDLLQAEARRREEMEETLRQTQKTEAIGRLTGGIAHDFNNLLTGIVGSLDLLQTRLNQGRTENVGRYIDAAMTSANRAAALTHRLLAFARRQPLIPKIVDANQLVVSLEDLLRRTIGEAIDLAIVVSDDLWNTLCDPNQLESALLNLAINARDAMPDGGRLTLSTANARLDGVTAETPALAPGDYICVAVTDTGTGMSAEVAARAFDPFFTTKPIGQGTGLGLSMIYGFVKQSGGQARISSRVGEGTTVRIYLPRHLGEADEDVVEAELADAPRAEVGETVLIVDDEPTIRMLITEVLGELGYTAIEAADTASGLRVLQSDVRVDLLITDIGLPGIVNGRQMADAARRYRPNLPVLFITGYPANAASLDGGMYALTKPFPMELLASRIKIILTESGNYRAVANS